MRYVWPISAEIVGNRVYTAVVWILKCENFIGKHLFNFTRIATFMHAVYVTV